MKENEKDTSYKLNDKKLPPHNYITLELVRRKIVDKDSDFELYLFDGLFNDVLKTYDFYTVLIATSYICSCLKRNKFKDEEGNIIENIYAYFKIALYCSLKKLTTPVYIDWWDY